MNVILFDELEKIILSLIHINNKFSLRKVIKETNEMTVIKDVENKDEGQKLYYQELKKLNEENAN